MFASNSSNDINPLPYPNSMEGDDFDYPPPSSYDLHFPDPFLDDHDLFFSHFLSSQQQQQQFIVGDAWEDYHDNHHQTSNNTTVVNTITNNKNNNKSKNKIRNNKTKSVEVTVATTTAAVGNGNGKKRNMISRKNPKNRTGKKDRHSKICTAQGPRDRRMRLSLQIARKFFDLQDMLGFDKASKTIEWLLSNSNSAIKELKEKNKSYSSYGYGSVISSGSSSVLSEININISKRRELKFCSKEEADKKSRKLCTVGRESRARARARARERTKEKLILKGLQNSKSNPTISLHQDFPGNRELQNPNSSSLLCSNSSVFSDPKPYIF